MSTPDVSLRLSADGTAVVSELKKIRGEFDTFTSGLKKTAAAAGVAFSAGALVGFVKNLVDAADALDDAAARVNVTTDSLQGLRLAAEDFGSSADTMDRALTELQGKLGKATIEGGKAAEAFASIGLSAEELSRLGTDDAFLAIADAVSELGDSSQRAALAQEFFGKAGKQLQPILGEGAAGVRDLIAEYERMGLILSRDSVARLAQAERAFRLARTSVTNLASEFLAGLSPALLAVSGSVRSAAAEFGGLEELGGKIGATFLASLAIVENGLRSLQAAFFGVAAAGARVLQALTFGDVSESFAASVDANLAKANAALAEIKSIEQIQASIVAQLEAARAAAGTSAAGGEGGGGGLLGEATLTPDQQRQAALDKVGGTSSAVFDNPFSEFEGLRADAAARAEADITAAAQEQLDLRLEAYSEFSDLYLALTGERIENELALEQIKAQSWGSILGTAVASFAASNEKIAKLAQGIAIAQAIWNTATGVTKALAAYDYVGAAKIAVMGAAQIAKIKATKYSGSVVSGGESFPAGAAGGGGAPANDVFNPANGTSGFEQRALRVEVVGQFTDQSGQVIAEMLAKDVREKDLVIIEQGTRQARELGGD